MLPPPVRRKIGALLLLVSACSSVLSVHASTLDTTLTKEDIIARVARYRGVSQAYLVSRYFTGITQVQYDYLLKRIDTERRNTQNAVDHLGSRTITRLSNITLTGSTITGGTASLDTLTVSGNSSLATLTVSGTTTLNSPLVITPGSAPSITTNTLYNTGGDLYWAGNLIGGATTGNWASDGTNVWRAGGNVGIGTTSPYAALSVAGQTVANYFTALASGTSTLPYTSVTGLLLGADYLTDLTGTGLAISANSLVVDSTVFFKLTDWYATSSPTIAAYISASSTIPHVGGSATNDMLYWTGSAWATRATSTLGVALSDTTGTLTATRGGTGLSTVTQNQLLIGGAGNTWTQVATSSLAVALGDTTGTLSLARGGTGQTAFGQGWLSSNGTTLTASTSPTVAYLTATSTTATSTFAGGLVAGGATGLTVLQNGRVGIGTTTPYSKFTVWGSGVGTGQAFEIANNASTTIARFLDNGTGYFVGNIGIGTTSPYAKLSVVGEAVADIFTATATTSTSTFAGNLNVGSGAFTYNNSSGITEIANLALGAQSFESDAGIISWIDMPVTSAATLGTVEAYSAQIDGNPLLTIYSESLGDGSTWNNAVGIGTTTPYALLSIVGIATSSSTARPLFDIASSSGASYLRVTGAGNLGLGTTTPAWLAQLAATTAPQLALTDSGAGTNLKHWTLRSLAGALYFASSSDAYATSSTPALTIDRNGKVGMGTTSPGYKLSVVGDVYASSFIDDGITIAAPDYVFDDPAYQHLTLDDVQTYTDEYKHLPWLTPRGSGAMSLSTRINEVLEALENLFLRVFEIADRNREQDTLINAQQAEIEALKARVQALDGETLVAPAAPTPAPAPEPTPDPAQPVAPDPAPSAEAPAVEPVPVAEQAAKE